MCPLSDTDGEERLSKLNGLAIRDEALDDFSGCVSFDLIHELHGFDDAQDLSLLDLLAGRDESTGAGRGRTVKSADNGRFDEVETDIGIGG